MKQFKDWFDPERARNWQRLAIPKWRYLQIEDWLPPMFFSSCCNLFDLFVWFVWFVVILAVLLLLLWDLACSMRYLVVQAPCLTPTHTLKTKRTVLLTLLALLCFWPVKLSAHWTLDTTFTHILTMPMTRKKCIQTSQSYPLNTQYWSNKNMFVTHSEYLTKNDLSPNSPIDPTNPKNPPTPITMQPPNNTQQNQLAACA